MRPPLSFGRHGGVRRPAVFQNLPMMTLFPTETAFGILHKLFPKTAPNFVQLDEKKMCKNS